MLDITYFSLIDAGIPIEDITTPAGRLWQYGVLNNCHEIEGVTAVLWGEIFWIVVWFCLSSDEYDDQRWKLAQAASAFDVYLQSPRVHQCMADTDDSGLMDQTEAMFVILSFCHPDVGPAPAIIHWKLQHRRIEDVAGTIRIGGTLSQDKAIHAACAFLKESILIYNPRTDRRLIAAYRRHLNDSKLQPPEEARFSHIHYHLFKLLQAPLVDLPYETPFLDNISHLFTRTKARYGIRICVSRKGDFEAVRPDLPSTDPYDSRNVICFDQHSYATSSPREWHPRLWELHQYSHWETASFVFLEGIPEGNDRSSPSGLAWWNLRKLIACADGCASSHIATYPADPTKADIFIEWQRPAHSHSLTASQAYEKAVGALLDLRPVSSQGCSPHTHIHPGIHLWLNPVPLGATETIDVVSFVFAEDLSEVDKRAFEFAALQFASCLDDEEQSGNGTPLIVNGKRDHWVKENGKLVFRLEFYWDVEDDEKVNEWMSKFLECEYFALGMKVHAMALMAEERKHWRVVVEHDSTEKFLEG